MTAHPQLPFPLVALLAALGLSSKCVVRADWPHYRGPTQNGVAAEPLPARLAGAPKVLWKTNVGTGISAVTVSGDRAFTMGNPTGSKDVVVCLDVKTGKPIWKHEFPLDLDPNLFEGGPRATPTVDNGLVYTVSHQGDLFALDAATGKKVWYRHFQRDFGGQRPSWGFSGSPLIDGNFLLLDVGGAGGSTVAVNKASGEIVWKSGSDKAGYASPVVAKIAGTRTAVLFKGEALVGLDVSNGRELWRTPWRTEYDVNAATPLVDGDSILISSGYGTGAGVYEVAGGRVTQRWRHQRLRAHFNAPIAHAGHFFGIDGNSGGGNLVCLEAATGALKWIEKSVKGGSLILAGDKLICFTEKGELVICDAASAGFRPILRHQILGKRCWVQPTLSGGRLLVKNNAGDVACLFLAAE